MIQPDTTRRPPDFDEFWRRTLARLTATPLLPQAKLVPLRSNEHIDTYDVSWLSLDAVRIAGWYCVPRGADRPLPGLVLVPGYRSEPPIPREWAELGYAALSVAPRGKLRSNSHFDPGYPGLLTHNILDRYTYGYRGLYCDAVRAVDFLRARPEVRGCRIGIVGSSQGGALAAVVAALRNDIAAAAVGVPFLCAISRAVHLTRTYPFEEINDYLRTYPERHREVWRTLSYFDVTNFAGHVEAAVRVTIGLQDDVCPPETGRVLFDALTTCREKELKVYDVAGHDGGQDEDGPLLQRFLSKHLRGDA